MDLAQWQAGRRALPGPIGWAVWLAATVPGPLLFWDSRLRWEVSLNLAAAALAMLPAAIVLAAVVAARWTAATGRRRQWSAFQTSVLVAMAVTTAGVAASLAVFRWIMPLSADYGDPGAMFLIGAGLLACAALIGAMIGHFLGRREGLALIRLPIWARYLLGATFAVAGALVAPVTLQLGAEDSTGRYETEAYGGVGRQFSSSSAGGPGELTAPNSGWYAIYAVGSSPRNPTAGSADPASASWPPPRSRRRRGATAATPRASPGSRR